MSNSYDGYVQAFGDKKDLEVLTERLESYFETVPYEESVEYSDKYYSFYSVQIDGGICGSLFKSLSEDLNLAIEIYAENPSIIEKGFFVKGKIISQSIENNITPYQDVQGMDLDIMEKYYLEED